MHSPPVQPISLEQVGDRLGDHDVARGQRQPVVHAGQPARAPPPAITAAFARTLPCFVSATTSPPRGARPRPPRCARRPRPRAREPAAQAPRQPRRLHRRRAPVEGRRRGRSASRIAAATCGGVERDAGVGLAELAAGRDRRLPGVVPGGRRRDLQVAGLAVPGVDSLVARRSRRSRHRALGRPRDGDRLAVAEVLAQRRQAEPEAVDRSRRCGRSAPRRSPPARAPPRSPRARSCLTCQAVQSPV